MPSDSLQDVFRATVSRREADIGFAPASAWSGLCSANDRARVATHFSGAANDMDDDVPTIRIYDNTDIGAQITKIERATISRTLRIALEISADVTCRRL